MYSSVSASFCSAAHDSQRASPLAVAVDERVELGERRELAAERVVEGAFERAAVEDVGEVEEGAGRGRQREPVADRDLPGVEVGGAVDGDAWTAASLSVDEDIDGAGTKVRHLPHRASAQVCQCSSRTPQECGRFGSSVESGKVSDREDARMLSVQLAANAPCA
jgi:hypothetical protein